MELDEKTGIAVSNLASIHWLSIEYGAAEMVVGGCTHNLVRALKEVRSNNEPEKVFELRSLLGVASGRYGAVMVSNEKLGF